QLLISPFDASTITAIAKGIEKARLNFQPVVEGNVIRIHIPPMDESTRRDTVNQAKEKGENTKVILREIRRRNNELVKKAKIEGVIEEDGLKKLEKQIQQQTDQCCREVDELLVAKEKEIMVI